MKGRVRSPVELRSGRDLLRLLLGGVPVAARAVQELDRAGDDLSAALRAVRRLPGGRFEARLELALTPDDRIACA